MNNVVKFFGSAVIGCIVAFLLGKLDAFQKIVWEIPVPVGREYVAQVATLHGNLFLVSMAMVLGVVVFGFSMILAD